MDNLEDDQAIALALLLSPFLTVASLAYYGFVVVRWLIQTSCRSGLTLCKCLQNPKALSTNPRKLREAILLLWWSTDSNFRESELFVEKIARDISEGNLPTPT